MAKRIHQLAKELGEKRVSFLDFIPTNTCIWLDDLDLILRRIKNVYDKTEIEEIALVKEEMLVKESIISEKLLDYNRIEFTRPIIPSPEKSWQFSTLPQTPFNKDFELLSSVLGFDRERHLQNTFP